MKIGYARVSTEEQCLDLQLSALKRAGCAAILSDYGVSGSRFDRPGLREALEMAKAGDALVVWRLDRLGRSLSHLVEVVSGLGKQGIEFVSLTESIDTRSPTGMLMFHMIAALAEFERSLISERTRAGMAAARARGAKFGRPRAVRPDWEEAHSPDETAAIARAAMIVDAAPRGFCHHGFHRCDLLPGRDNPSTCCIAHSIDMGCSLPDVIGRTRRRADQQRIGRRSRYAS
ncbi:recombinase family protein [Burkholderia ubonensis]|uniref:recombinase family protein n=1 Tax=Burkholderia ubonensis TaxID=101571 RepID=UPI0009B3A8F4|nr:recombinase family protein [Burkholderia ubonensis]